MSVYNVVHIESGKSIIINKETFNRNEILQQASTEMNTALDIKRFGEYGIYPTSPQ